MKLRRRVSTNPNASPFHKNKSSNTTRKSFQIPSNSSASTPSTSSGTFASAVSGWNTNNGKSTASTSLTQPSTSPMASDSNPQRQTSCLLCSGYVLLFPPNLNSNTRLHKLLITLCKNLAISTDEIPDPSHCTQINFPFCGSCEPKLVELWKQQKILDDVPLKIQRIVEDIERVVVDAEVLEPAANRPGSSSMAETEQRKSSKLGDLILEGYQKKRMIRYQQENEANAMRPAVVEPSPIELKMEVSDQAEFLNEDDVENEYDENYEEVPTSIIDQAIVAPYDDGGDDYENEEQPQSFPEGRQTEDPEVFEGSFDPGMDARYNNANSAMVIINENAETGVISRIEVKQERCAPAVEESDDGDSDSNQDGDVFSLAERKRRFLYEGVEIYRATEARSKVDYLQCSLCSYMLPIKKYNTRKVSTTYMKMKTHVLHVHKGKSGAPKPRRVVELREHNAQHPESSSLNCDICGKPFRQKSSQYNLLIHKFSHKNDEERRISLASGERGSSNCMLSTKRNMALVVRKRPAATKRRKPVYKPGNPYRPSANSRESEGSGKQFNCDLCSRAFGRNCHLFRHMSSHSHVGDIHDQHIPSTSIASRAATRRRQAVGAEPVRATLSPPPPPPPVTSNLANANVLGDSVSEMNVSCDGSQRLVIRDGTVVIVQREVLELIRNNQMHLI